jgi:ABC-type sugar transport system substrate-binding protein
MQETDTQPQGGKLRTGKRLARMMLLLVVAALVVAGCGSDDKASDSGSGATDQSSASAPAPKSDSFPNPDLTGVPAQEGEAKAKAEAEGAKAAEAAGGATDKLPRGLTVGYLQIIGGIESADRVANSTKLALESLGYSVLYCDGKGDPQAQVTCGNTLLDKGAKAIFTNGIDSSVIASVLRKAKEKDVPVIATAGETPGYDGNYAPSETKQGENAVNWLTEQLGPEGGKIAVQRYPAPWAKGREDVLDAAIKEGNGIEIAAEATADPTKLIESTKATVSTWLTQSKDLKALWFSFDVAGQAGGQQAGQAGGDNGPAVVTFHAEPSTQELIKAGAIDAASDANYDASSWIAVDQLAEHLARDTPFSQEVAPEYPGLGDGYTYQVITKDNLPPEGQKYATTDVDVVSYFKAKWKTEFGL